MAIQFCTGALMSFRVCGVVALLSLAVADRTATAQAVRGGLVRAWGYNSYGQCNVPSDLGPCTKIDAGGNYYGFTVAIRTDGIVRAWGYNGYGQCNVPGDLGACSDVVAGGSTYDGWTVAIQRDTSDIDSDGIPAWRDNCPSFANADQTDCNGDEIGDACQEPIVTRATSNMGAFSYAAPANGTLTNCTLTTTPVTVTLSVIADLGNATNEFASLKLGGTMIQQFMFLAGGTDCPASAESETITVSAAVWNALVTAGSGTISVQVIGSVLVDGTQCPSPFCQLNVRYGGPDYDCNLNGIQDLCEIAGGAADCDADGRLDACEIAAGSESDVDSNGVPDACQGDCNGNGLPDAYELANNLVPDCNNNDIPDSCDIVGGAAQDCNGNAIPDSCDIVTGVSIDCNGNAIPDSCDIATGTSQDCNANTIPDSCDIATGLSNDVEPNGVPDECKIDCNTNGLPDAWEILTGLVPDCNSNAIPDSCDIASTTSRDCDLNAIPDSCDIVNGASDKDQDGRPDACELARGDWDLSGTIDGIELSILLSMWGVANPPVGDYNGDGSVDGFDLAAILSLWGPVPD